MKRKGSRRAPRRVLLNENQRPPASWVRFALLAVGTLWMTVETVLRFLGKASWARMHPAVILFFIGWATWHEWKWLHAKPAAPPNLSPPE